MLRPHWLQSLSARILSLSNHTRRGTRRISRRNLPAAVQRLDDRTLLTVSSSFDAMLGVLTVTADAADNVAVTASGGNVKINGADPDSGTLAAGSISQITVTASGNFSNQIDLSGVTAAAGFSAFLSNLIEGGEGNDTITGSDFRDTINGGEGDDLLIGGAGDDQYEFFMFGSGSQNDVIDESGGGIDFVCIFTAAGGATLDLSIAGAQTVVSGTPSLTLTLGSGSTIENACANFGGNLLTGNDLDNQLNGGGTLNGGLGNDTLFGLDGSNDSLVGGDGDDVYLVLGGSAQGADLIDESSSGGSDTFDLTSYDNGDGTGVTVDLDSTSAQSFATGGGTFQFQGTIENFIGSQFSDTISVRPLANVTRTIEGFDPAGGSPGDTLNVDLLGSSFTHTPGASGSGTIDVTLAGGTGTIIYSGIETLNLLNQPSAVATSTTVTASPASPGTFGETVTFTATVTLASGSSIPTGTVTFTVDGVSGSPVAVSGAGTASFSTDQLGVGSHTVSAEYTSDSGSFTGSTSSAISYAIVPAVLTFTGTGGSDHLILRRNAAGDVFEIVGAGSSSVLASLARSGTSAIAISTLGGHDSLTIDESNGLIDAPGGVQFNGGDGQDSLAFTGGVAVDATYQAGPGADSGFIERTGRGGTTRISFTGLEPVIDTTPGTLTVIGTNADNAINLAIGPNSGVTNAANPAGAATGVVSVDGFETFEFANKSVVTINGRAGQDVFGVSNLSSGLATGGIVVLRGGDPAGGDRLIVSGTAGDDTFGYLPHPELPDAGVITGLGGGLLFFGIEDVTVAGGTGSDAITTLGNSSGSSRSFTTPVPDEPESKIFAAAFATNSASGTDTILRAVGSDGFRAVDGGPDLIAGAGGSSPTVNVLTGENDDSGPLGAAVIAGAVVPGEEPRVTFVVGSGDGSDISRFELIGGIVAPSEFLPEDEANNNSTGTVNPIAVNINNSDRIAQLGQIAPLSGDVDLIAVNLGRVFGGQIAVTIDQSDRVVNGEVAVNIDNSDRVVGGFVAVTIDQSGRTLSRVLGGDIAVTIDQSGRVIGGGTVTLTLQDGGQVMLNIDDNGLITSGQISVTIDQSGSVTGTVGGEVAVNINNSDRIAAIVNRDPNGNGEFTPVNLRLLGQDGETELLVGSNIPGAASTSLLSAPLAAGTYFLELTNGAPDGDADYEIVIFGVFNSQAQDAGAENSSPQTGISYTAPQHGRGSISSTVRNDVVELTPRGNKEARLRFNNSTPLELVDFENVTVDPRDGVDQLEVFGTVNSDVLTFDAATLTVNGQTFGHANTEIFAAFGNSGDDAIGVSSGLSGAFTADGGDGRDLLSVVSPSGSPVGLALPGTIIDTRTITSVAVEAFALNAGSENVVITGAPDAVSGVSLTPTSAAGVHLDAAGRTYDVFTTGTLTVAGAAPTAGSQLPLRQLDIHATIFDDTVSVSDTGVDVGGGLKAIALSGIGSVGVFGGNGLDTFNVTPSATTSFFIDGDNPIGFGDVLNIVAPAAAFFAGPQNDEGAYSATGTRPVSFDRIESHQVTPPVTRARDIQTFPNIELKLDSLNGASDFHGAGQFSVLFDGSAGGSANDSDGDGLDDVEVVLQSLNLTSAPGGFSVRLRPGTVSSGVLKETTNNTPGTLDLVPYAASGTGHLTLDLHLELYDGALVLHTAQPIRVESNVTEAIAHINAVLSSSGILNVPLIDASTGLPYRGFTLSSVHFVPEALRDFGDLADDPANGSDIPTLLASNGARHLAVGPVLGTVRDAEVDGQPTLLADGDDRGFDGTSPDDEDGVTFSGALIPGGLLQVTVTGTAGSHALVAVDLNRDGDWDDLRERETFMTVASQTNLAFAIPRTTTPGPMAVRVRISSQPINGVSGLALDGEVEDYVVQVAAPPQAPTAPSNGSGSSGSGSSGGMSSDTPNPRVTSLIDLPGLMQAQLLPAGPGQEGYAVRFRAVSSLDGTEYFAAGAQVGDSNLFEGFFDSLPTGDYSVRSELVLLTNTGNPLDPDNPNDPFGASPPVQLKVNPVRPIFFSLETLQDGESDEYVLRRVGDVIELRTTGGVFLAEFDINVMSALTIDGSGDNDRLIVDFAGGNPIPVDGLTFNGGGETSTDGDLLELRGGSALSVEHRFANASSGSIIAGIDGRLSTITYTGVEPIIDSLIAIERSFTFGPMSEVITISDDATPDDGRSQISSPVSETVVFASPSGRLIINAGDGHDFINVAGLDALFAARLVLHGGKGNDRIDASQSPVAVKIIGGVGSDTLFGSEFDDAIHGRGGNDLISGLAGDDNLAGNEGHDQLLGGDGNDRLMGHAGNDSLSGGDGDDRLFGGSGDDTFAGGNGDDTVFGGDGMDALLEAFAGQLTLLGRQLHGDAGIDRLHSIEQATISGSPGDDRFDFSGAAFALTIDALAGNDWIAGGSGNDDIEGGSGDDTIHGGAGADRLSGGDGADQISGDDGADLILAGNGNDLVNGGNDADTIFGGGGDDLIAGGNGNDSLMGDDGHDLIAGGDGLDVIRGGDGRDSISGGTGDDKLYGGSGADLILGDDGNDTVFAGSGDDRVDGGQGSDLLFGGDGNDTIFGGSGGDDLRGEAGNDLLAGGPELDSLAGNDGTDTVRRQAGLDVVSTAETLLDDTLDDVFTFDLPLLLNVI